MLPEMDLQFDPLVFQWVEFDSIIAHYKELTVDTHVDEKQLIIQFKT